MKHSQKFIDLVNQVRPTVNQTDVFEVKKRLDQGESLNLIDVREESEWAQARIPGAQHISKGVLERDIESLFPDTQEEIILYCGGGYRSVLAAENLKRMGYQNPISMDGGFRAWKDAEYTLDK